MSQNLWAAIWASDSNILLAQKKLFEPARLALISGTDWNMYYIKQIPIGTYVTIDNRHYFICTNTFTINGYGIN